MPINRRAVLGSAVLVVATMAGGGCAAAGPAPRPAASTSSMFEDDFETLEVSRWTAGVPHQLGRSAIDPQNVAVDGGLLRLGMPANTLAGAELRTQGTVPRGVYRSRLQAAKSPASVTGFFLYAPPDFAQEIDIELYNRPDGLVRLTTYDAGKMTATREVPLGFDPTAAFHDYAIALTDGDVEFYADSVLLGSWGSGVPAAPMNLYLNTWYPQWLSGVPATTEQATLVDSVSVRPR